MKKLLIVSAILTTLDAAAAALAPDLPARRYYRDARAMINDPLWWLKVFAQEGPAAQTSMWPSNAASCLT
jgi:hypothetical protein